MHRSALLALPLVLTIASPAPAEVQTKEIQYEHDGTPLAGFMAWDDAQQAKRPAVLVVHEWWGLNDYARMRAKKLAELGYVAFALDMYGKGKVTEHPKQAAEWAGKARENIADWRARAAAGLRVLKQNEMVDSDRIAAIGYCFGGATVLQMALDGAPLRGVVSFHGALPMPAKDRSKSIGPKILICHGADDGFIPEDHVQKFRAGLDEAEADWQMIYYSGAKHSFTNPSADEYGVDGVAYNERADRRSWEHMKVFFEEILR